VVDTGSRLVLCGLAVAVLGAGACRRPKPLDRPAQLVAEFAAAMSSRDTVAVRRIAASDLIASSYTSRADFGGGRWASIPINRLVSPDTVFHRGDTLAVRYQTHQRQRCGDYAGPDDYIDATIVRRDGADRLVFIQLGPGRC